jgi:arylsulfatase A-like enzyme
MSPRSRLSLASTLAVLSAFACGEEAPRGRPNIVLVSIDSLRRDHVGCYGYSKPTTPAIDELAQKGARFDVAVSTTSWTLPAHAALFTGLYDSTHGLVDNGQRLAPEHRTLAEELQALGYHTAGFFGGPYLHPAFGLGDGFDVYQSCMTTIADDLGDDALRNESRARDGKSHDDITGPRTIAEVAKWADARPKDRPYFLFVHLWDVHYDFIPPEKYARMFDRDYTGSVNGVDFMSNPAVHANMPARDLEHLLALYDGEIRFTDDNLGTILDELRERAMLDNTLIVVTADHGEEFFEHRNKGHQKGLFDEVVRVPLVMSWPGALPRGRVIDQQVRTIDVMPTLLRIAGASALPTMEGRDLRPLIDGRADAARPALLELNADGRDARALRTAELKVINPGHGVQAGGFDLQADPRELRPLQGPIDPRIAGGLAELEKLRDGARSLREYLGAKSRSAEVDAATLERLRQLGYVDRGQ